MAHEVVFCCATTICLVRAPSVKRDGQPFDVMNKKRLELLEVDHEMTIHLEVTK